MKTTVTKLVTRVTRALRANVTYSSRYKNMMPLIGNPSREVKEELVRDLYFNKGKSYHEIAKQARVSLRDIKGILDGDTPKEQAKSKAAQTYDLFSKGKSPMEVAIILDLREPEVTQLYRESLSLMQIAELNRTYLETNGNLVPFLNLYKMAKAAGCSMGHVVCLLGHTDIFLMQETLSINSSLRT